MEEFIEAVVNVCVFLLFLFVTSLLTTDWALNIAVSLLATLGVIRLACWITR